MDKSIDAYLEKVSRGLHLSEADKTDVIGEIRNHIHEAVNRQEPLESVLKKLGEPYKLAKAYNHSYKLANDEFRLSDILNSIAFYSSVAITGMVVVTVLPILTITFVLTSVFIIGISITNLIGLTNLPFNIGFMPVTGWPQIVMAVVISALFLLIARASWSGLKKYLKYVSNNYHKRRVG